MSQPWAYYNEYDEKAAAWLRTLIAAGLIADGEVDTRSIVEVGILDLKGFTQCHFFAGIGGWSHALRLAGWPDDQPIWTGSCPCQPFSAAGKRKGLSDERHLWPYFLGQIAEGRPPVVVGEQVASPDGLRWLDVVSTDLEDQNYAFGAADLCAAGVGAPHIRQRLYWVGDTEGEERRLPVLGRRPLEDCAESDRTGEVGELGDRDDARPGDTGVDCAPRRGGEENHGAVVCDGGTRDVADDDRSRRGTGRSGETGDGRDEAREQPTGLRDAVGGMADADGRESGDGDVQRGGRHGQQPENPLAGFWSDAEWIYCRDDKWRPVEPGTFPLAHGVPARVGRLRGYGNAIVPQVAAAFIAAYCEARGLTWG